MTIQLSNPPSVHELKKAISNIGDGFNRLGLERTSHLTRVDDFIAGPPIVGVIGSERSGKSTLVRKLSESIQGVAFDEKQVKEASSNPLWDAVVVVTPSDMALSHVELELLKALRKLQRPCYVVVSMADLLGSDSARRAGEDEIARLRLGPNLDPLQILWWFVGKDDSPDELVGAIDRLQRQPADFLHSRVALDALSQTLSQSREEMVQRVDQRDRERAALSSLQAEVPLVLTHLAEEARLCRLRLRDAIRETEQGVVDATGQVAEGLVGWVVRSGRGDVQDVTKPFTDASKILGEELESAMRECEPSFRAEALRVTKTADALAEKLELEILALSLPAWDWFTTKSLDALEHAKNLNLSPIVEDAITLAKEELARRDQESGGTKKGKSGKEDSGGDNEDGIVRRTVAAIAKKGDVPLGERLRNHMLMGVESLLGPRLKALLDSASDDVEIGSSKAVEDCHRAFQEQVEQIRSPLTKRYEWSDAYQLLLSYGDRIDEIRRVRSV